MKILNTFSAFYIVISLVAGAGVVATTGCSSYSRTHESAGEEADDAAISNHVVAALAATSDYKFTDVQVNTFKRRVQLSGFVDSDSHKDKAEVVAKQVDGVKEVINNITVK